MAADMSVAGAPVCAEEHVRKAAATRLQAFIRGCVVRKHASSLFCCHQLNFPAWVSPDLAGGMEQKSFREPSATTPGVARQGCEERSLGQLQLGKECEDAFDQQGVSNELVMLWAERENKAVSGAEGQPLPPMVRDACVRFMSYLAQVMHLPQRSWFDCVVLFDMYCLRCPAGEPYPNLPSLVVAIVKMLKKTDNARLCLEGTKFSVYSVALAQCLQKLGYPAVEGSEDTLVSEEKNLLQVLQWDINMPSIESWLSTFCARFNVLTRSVYTQRLNWVWQQSLHYARWLVLRQVSNGPEIPVRRLARGLVGVTLVLVRLLPLDSLRPSKVSAKSWELLFAQTNPNGHVPECALSEPDVGRLLKLLEVAMGVNIVSLQEDVELVAALSKDILTDLAQHVAAHVGVGMPAAGNVSAPMYDPAKESVQYACC